MTHTPEPWTVIGPCAQWETGRIFAGTRYIGSIGNSDETEQETRANAARIVACVNACAGMEDPSVYINRLAYERDKARQERDTAESKMMEMETALKFYATSIWNDDYPGGITTAHPDGVHIDMGNMARDCLKKIRTL